jgi:phospholipid transport system substrate-binding protein
MKLLNRFSRLFAAIMLLAIVACIGIPAHAGEAPDALIKRISQEVLDAAKDDKDLQARNFQRVRPLVETQIVPHVDFRKTTPLAMGRYWREATPEQQQRLTAEFRELLIHTYAGALSQVKDQRLEVRPLRADAGDTDAQVQSRIVPRRGEPIQLDYRLAKIGDAWKIYDINIMGAWLVATYRNNFLSEVNRGGIDGLIQTLAERNRQLSANTTQKAKSAG